MNRWPIKYHHYVSEILDRSFLLQMYALKINRIETGLGTEKDERN